MYTYVVGHRFDHLLRGSSQLSLVIHGPTDGLAVGAPLIDRSGVLGYLHQARLWRVYTL